MKTARLPVLALGAVLAVAAPVAASATPEPASTSSLSTSTPTKSVDQQARGRLHELATTQTQAQIQEILDSNQPAQVLYDVETKKYLAAYTVGPVVPELSLDPFTAPAE